MKINNIFFGHKYTKYRFLLFLVAIQIYIIKEPNYSILEENLLVKKRLRPFLYLFDKSIKINNTILIFEPNKYHHECLPGYSKYFIDLGYNVDILLHTSGISSFILFKEIDSIRLFTFRNINQITKEGKKLSIIIKKYDFILFQTNNFEDRQLYNKLGLLSLNNSFFIFHEALSLDGNYLRYAAQNRIWTLGNISKYVQVNPHYFGNNIKIKNKNVITKFFFTSSEARNYRYLMESLKRLKNEKFDFKIIITGRSRTFKSKHIPKILNKNIKLRYGVSYYDLFKAVEHSDYIIIPLNPYNNYESLYNKIKVTGSMQLSYGFIKPVIINQEFADFYNLNPNNSLLYNNFNLYDILRKAIMLNNENYKKLQQNLYSLEKKIYLTSVANIKKVFNKP